MPPNATADTTDTSIIASGTKAPVSSGSGNNNNSRRYSLFGGNHTSLLPIGSLFGTGGDDGSSSRKHQLAAAAGMASNNNGTICQRCKRFEVDLTNTSDDLSATDTELKASRQVISLLQRQLELLRVEKAGLEQLIVSQANNLRNTPSPQPLARENLTQSPSSEGPSNLIADIDAACVRIDTAETTSNDDSADLKQGGKRGDLLLDLIRTQLYVKDEEIVKLKYSLKETLNDKEQLVLQVHLLEGDVARLKSENIVLSENLALRDQTIVSLSNEVFEQSNSSEASGATSTRRQSSAEALGAQISSFKAQRSMAKLIDTLDAYKKTNELLSTNVMKLTDRCTRAEQKEIESRSQCHELEAKCCQIQSKLLSLLKEIEQSSKQPSATSNDASQQKNQEQEVICSESVKLLIKRLLEDKSLDIPLSWKEGNKSSKDNNKDDNRSSSSKYECDELGFYILVEDEKEKTTHSSTPSACETTSPKSSSSVRRALSNLPKVEEGIEVGEEFFADRDCTRKGISRQVSVDATKSDEASWHIRWDNFIKDFDKIDLTKSRQFKFLLRSGVPQEYRCKIWKALVNLRIGKDRERHGPDYYQSLLEPNRPQSSSAPKKPLNPSSKQIELDLLRTLPNNKHFETLDSSGTVRLRRVLTAYSEHNPKVGYCQGMNRLAAVALLVLPEEEAFWCLVTIIENIMPQGYYNDLWLAQVDSNVVMDFLAIKMPDLSDHFKHYGVDLSLFAWFLTIFVDGTPPALFLRLWDSYLYEGDKILFRVALALLKMYESDLLKLNNSVAINNFLRRTVNAPMDVDQFFDISFDWINPLSTRSLKAKRQHNFQQLRFEFEGTRSNSNSLEHHYRTDSEQVEDTSIMSI